MIMDTTKYSKEQQLAVIAKKIAAASLSYQRLKHEA